MLKILASSSQLVWWIGNLISTQQSTWLQECVHWDLHTNFWTTEGAVTLASNASHTICSFTYLSTYAVMQRRVHVTDYDFLAVVIGSILLAIAMFSIATIAVIYWRRIKVGECALLVF